MWWSIAALKVVLLTTVSQDLLYYVLYVLFYIMYYVILRIVRPCYHPCAAATRHQSALNTERAPNGDLHTAASTVPCVHHLTLVDASVRP